MISTRLFEGLVPAADSSSGLGSATTAATTVDSLSGASAVSDCGTAEDSENARKRQPLAPLHVLAPPPEMKLPWAEGEPGLMIPEGRVHGGGLMSLLGGSIRNPGFSGRI